MHALPVLHGLRMRFPQAKIDWLIAVPFAPLLENHPDLDDLILFDRKRFGRMARSPRAALEFLQFVRGLRSRRYDLVIDLQALFRTGFLSWVSGADIRIGFYGAREGAWLFYNHDVKVRDSEMHAVDRYYLVADLLGFADVPVKFSLSVPDALSVEAGKLLGSMGLGDHDHVVAVVPGARWDTKVWPAERFIEAIDALHAGGRMRCVLLGGNDELALCEQIARSCKSEPINLAGRTSIPQLAAVVSLADVVLCHDSAAAHLAVALERELVCLTGPTNPRRTGPYGRPEDVLRLELDCSPCYLRRLSQCPHGHRCMNDLDSQSVVEAVSASIRRLSAVGT